MTEVDTLKDIAYTLKFMNVLLGLAVVGLMIIAHRLGKSK